MTTREPPPQLWHLSFDQTLESIWRPRKRAIGEPAHISVCPSIEQCVQSLYPGLGRFFKHDPKLAYLILHVYRPLDASKVKMLSSDILTDRIYVANAHVTGERWILDPVKMVHAGRVKVHRPKSFEQGSLYNAPGRGIFTYPTDIDVEWVDEGA